MSEYNVEEGDFLPNYAMALLFSYQISLGEAEVEFDDSMQQVYLWILYVACGILTTIVMLNLLIAIISESFARINSNMTLANY